ncbi:MAG: hypothetical protein HYR85_24790 [Planctomycetes bacterium]|nr:hypothetical protein [Planctomycetota bacterium]MBI3846700.1 hypothetical protein [Planctomycetota bacterium]
MNVRPLAIAIVAAIPALAHAGGGTIRGTVYTEEAQPGPGYLVLLLHDGGGDRQAMTDDRGNYEFTDVAAGDGYVAVVGGHIPLRFDGPSVSVADGQVVVADIGPKPASKGEGCSFGGKILTEAVGELASFDKLFLVPLDGAGGFCCRMARIREDRRFGFADVPPGNYSAVLRSANGGFVRHVEIPRKPEYICELGPVGDSISGVIRDAKTTNSMKSVQVLVWDFAGSLPSATAAFEATGRSTETDVEGRYRINGLHAGKYLVEVGTTEPGNGDEAVSHTRETALVSVVDGKGTTADFALGPAVSMDVVARTTGGSRVPGPSVRVDDWPSESPLDDYTIDRRKLRVGGLKAGEHVVTVSHPWFAAVRRRVRVGEMGGHEEFVLMPGGSLTVTVVDRAGKAVDGASIEIVDKSGERVSTDRGTWDRIVPPQTATIAGRFRVAHIAAGTYTVRATKASAGTGSAAVTVIERGDATVRIAFQ